MTLKNCRDPCVCISIFTDGTKSDANPDASIFIGVRDPNTGKGVVFDVTSADGFYGIVVHCASCIQIDSHGPL
jgi:hypothetical protein